METMLLDDIELRETAKRLYDSYSTVLSESKLISSIQDVLGDFAPALDSKYAARTKPPSRPISSIGSSFR